MPPRPSSNWLALQKTVAGPSSGKKRKARDDTSPAVKRQKVERAASPISTVTSEPIKLAHAQATVNSQDASIDSSIVAALPGSKNGESLPTLRQMVLGQITHTDAQKQPGKYLALDCEMVGVGPEGAESSLARVSIVNFYGAVQLDAFVRQRERVVDYRTEFSGIRASDMVNARPFDEVQKKVAELIKDRILVGHAVYNDTKALLLSHPRPQTRDTQYYAWKSKVVKTNRVALRNLVRQELGLVIQSGEHSSVTDARATMAIYRLHRKEWEKHARPVPDPTLSSKNPQSSKPSEEQFPGGGRKGVSSGLSVVVTKPGGKSVRHGSGSVGPKTTRTDGKKKGDWWKELGSGSVSSKGSVRVKM